MQRRLDRVLSSALIATVLFGLNLCLVKAAMATEAPSCHVPSSASKEKSEDCCSKKGQGEKNKNAICCFPAVDVSAYSTNAGNAPIAKSSFESADTPRLPRNHATVQNKDFFTGAPPGFFVTRVLNHTYFLHAPPQTKPLFF